VKPVDVNALIAVVEGGESGSGEAAANDVNVGVRG
jgi:hypothetical protein